MIQKFKVFFAAVGIPAFMPESYCGNHDSGPFQLSVQRDGNNLTLTWPECPNSGLEWAAELSGLEWVTATNPVGSSEGRKTVILTPAENTGFYRLVSESVRRRVRSGNVWGGAMMPPSKG